MRVTGQVNSFQYPFNPDDFRVLECRIIARILFLPERRSVVQPPRSNNIATHLRATCTAHVAATRARPDNLEAKFPQHTGTQHKEYRTTTPPQCRLCFVVLFGAEAEDASFCGVGVGAVASHPGDGHLHGWYHYWPLQWIHAVN